MRQKHVQSYYTAGGPHDIYYTEWGEADNPQVLFCAHGLTRNSRDFDYLAKAMSDHYRVICPDYPGRGLSPGLDNPAFYDNSQYMVDSLALLATLNAQIVDWVGTSMGGLIGMGLAVSPNTRIRKMVLNDVGAFLPGDALNQISGYIKHRPDFDSIQQAEDYFRKVYIGFGPLTDEQYLHLAKHGVWQQENRYTLNCDNAIIEKFINVDHQDIDLWELWNAINPSTLIIRGEHSTLLRREDMEEMCRVKDNAQCVEFAQCGHAPSLMAPEHIETIREWLLS